MVKILKNLLYQLNKGKHGNIMNEAFWSEPQLIIELREILRDKRYFIVIDDIWDYSVWETIRYALIENGNGSKIITTTRNAHVANQIGGVYSLIPLSLIHSRKLFHQRIYGDEDKSLPSHLAEVSDIILNKCGGIPLAIITIAGILASKKGMTHEYWSKVSRSMGTGLEDSPQIQKMRRILSLSYYDLPPHLKTCLLYLGLFPEDHDITREYLIWKWVGEAFVRKEHGKSLYEVGENYLDELISKGMVKPVEFDGCSKATTCRVHDMVLDLITSLSNDEHFLTAVGGQQLMPLPSKVRRLSLQTGNAEDVRLLSTVSFTHVRSVTVFDQALNLLPGISCFPVLRALDLSDCEQVDNHRFKGICKLFHLRYLCLRRTSVTEVPKQIGNLQFLQVLDISLTEVKVLPSTFVQLTQLVYLNVSAWTRLPDGFGKLECLQNFPGITVSYPSMLHDLGRLTELRNLKIIKFIQCGENYDEPFLECLSNLVSLEKLEVNYYLGGPDFGLSSSLSPGPQRVYSIDMLRSTFYAVPRWMSSLSCLSALEITIRTLAVQDFEVLGKIPSLTDLYVWVLEPTGERPERLAIDSRYPFRCLSVFRFWSYGMEVVFSRGAMPNLQTLDLDFQVRKTKDLGGNFYFGLENLPLLQRVPVKIDCYCTEPGEVEAAEAALQKGVDMNPNKPMLNILKYGEMG
uniref:Uncharacterized protein n=1 Tax=Avena sativa TaxID=4498 RepID=A0ACD5WJM2_AVESA